MRAIRIGAAGGPEKTRLAKQAGAHETIDYRTQDFEAEVKRITSGAGVHVVYDSVGKDTWEKSLRCLRPRGVGGGPIPVAAAAARGTAGRGNGAAAGPSGFFAGPAGEAQRGEECGG